LSMKQYKDEGKGKYLFKWLNFNDYFTLLVLSKEAKVKRDRLPKCKMYKCLYCLLGFNDVNHMSKIHLPLRATEHDTQLRTDLAGIKRYVF
jgi:hypothetical protein